MAPPVRPKRQRTLSRPVRHCGHYRKERDTHTRHTCCRDAMKWILTLLVLCSVAPFLISAQTAEELRAQISSQNVEIEKLNKKNMNNAYAESRKRGMLHQAEQRVSDLFNSYCYLVQMSIYSSVTSCISPSFGRVIVEKEGCNSWIVGGNCNPPCER